MKDQSRDENMVSRGRRLSRHSELKDPKRLRDPSMGICRTSLPDIRKRSSESRLSSRTLLRGTTHGVVEAVSNLSGGVIEVRWRSLVHLLPSTDQTYASASGSKQRGQITAEPHVCTAHNAAGALAPRFLRISKQMAKHSCNQCTGASLDVCLAAYSQGPVAMGAYRKFDAAPYVL